MKTVVTQTDLRQQVRVWRQQGLTIGFVPTMGNLHAGHISLVELAKQRADKVIVSIFVNPLQFNDKADLSAYPRTLEQDALKLSDAECDLIFTPSVEVMYPQGMADQSVISVPRVGDRLCGAHRPGHFDGVATVVAKLFNLVSPDIAIFGEKDYQQLLLIKKMVVDMNMAIDIVSAPTRRESNGLAMSSRNQYLTTEQQQQAAALYQHLEQIKQQLQQGHNDWEQLCEQTKQQLAEQGFKPDYVEICRADDLMPAKPGDKALRILVAAQFGTARLIDNIACDLA